MALITCPECGNQISDQAVSCPVCGYPIRQPIPGYAAGQPAYHVPQQPQVIVYPRPKVPGRGFGISGMVLGIIGAVYSIPTLLSVLVTLFSDPELITTILPLAIEVGIMGILALIFGISARARGFKRGQSVAAIILSVLPILSLAFTAVLTLLSQFNFKV